MVSLSGCSRELTAKKLRNDVRLTTEIVPTEVKLGTGVALQVVPWDLVFSGAIDLGARFVPGAIAMGARFVLGA